MQSIHKKKLKKLIKMNLREIRAHREHSRPNGLRNSNKQISWLWQKSSFYLSSEFIPGSYNEIFLVRL